MASSVPQITSNKQMTKAQKDQIVGCGCLALILIGVVVVVLRFVASTGYGPKYQAFVALVRQYKSFNQYATADEQDVYRRRLGELQEQFEKIPFNPKEHRDEAKAICEMFKSEIEHQYSGFQYDLLEATISEIYKDLTIR